MNSATRHGLGALLVLVLVGCATKPPPPAPVAAPTGRVILLPQADGRSSAVEVSTSSGRQLIAVPYQMAEVGVGGVIKLDQTTDAQVAKKYGDLLAGKPPAGKRYTLLFVSGTSNLTPDSEKLVPEIMAQVRARAGGEVIVTGHTDRVGTVEANDALSLQRAQAVRSIFVRMGLVSDLVEAVGRGEREPLVPTADEVAEPRNRRAEIVVR